MLSVAMLASVDASLAEYAHLYPNTAPPPVPPKSNRRRLQGAKNGIADTLSFPLPPQGPRLAHGSPTQPKIGYHGVAQTRTSPLPHTPRSGNPTTNSYFSDDSSSDGSRMSTTSSSGSAVTQILAVKLAINTDVSGVSAPPPSLSRWTPVRPARNNTSLSDGLQPVPEIPQRDHFVTPLPLIPTWNNIPSSRWEAARESELWTPVDDDDGLPAYWLTTQHVNVPNQQLHDTKSPKQEPERSIPVISEPLDAHTDRRVGDTTPRIPLRKTYTTPEYRDTPRLQVPFHKRGSSAPLLGDFGQGTRTRSSRSPVVANGSLSPSLYDQDVSDASSSSMSSVPFDTDEDKTWLTASPLDFSPLTPLTTYGSTSAMREKSSQCYVYSPQSRFSMDSDMEEDLKPLSPQVSPFGLQQHGYVYDAVVPEPVATKSFDEKAVGENTLQWLGAQRKRSYHVRNNSASDRHQILGRYFHRSSTLF